VKQVIPNKKTIVGTVVSDKMDKTVTVLWETRKKHRLYKKFVKERTKIKAHDEKNEAEKGDLVKVIESRPMSKDKAWRVVEILEKAQRG
jgi:small subunit ribosomal protein S17